MLPDTLFDHHIYYNERGSTLETLFLCVENNPIKLFFEKEFPS